MASLVLLRNPLTPHTREIYPLATGTPVINWLQAEAPNGFGMPVKFYVNGTEKPLDDLDYEVAEDDVAIIALMPGEPGTLTLSAFLIQLAISAILAGASFALSYFFQPQARSGRGDKPVSIYDISSDQNAAKIGDAIPVLYGTMRYSPDYIAQPYGFFDWSQADYTSLFNGIQYLHMLLCLGHGNIDVSEVHVGETDAASLPSGTVSYQVFKPADHGSTMGTISTAMGGGFHENVISCPEVSNQEFINADEEAGYFATCKPGQSGSKFQIDILFPGGLVDPNEDGDAKGRAVEFKVEYQKLDDNDTPIGSVYDTTIKASTKNSATITGPNNTDITPSPPDEENKTAIVSPIRRSYMITAPSSGRWAVKLTRITAAPNSKNGEGRFIWTGLRLYADYPSGSAYGNVTLLAVKIKAGQGVGNDASARISVKATRRLQPPAGGTEAASTSGADAFADVYCDTVYGANRPRSELDTAALNALRTSWASYQFNHIFRDRITVWEALRTVATPFGAEPLPVGPVMSVVQDGVKPVRSMLFTDANIVSNSMSVNYSWDEEGAPDGIEIEYLDPKDFRQSYVRYPTTSLRPDQFTLPGCTSATHAAQYARLTWQRRQGQRKRITFDTELEGLLLQLGDRIGVSHNVPKWGTGASIIGVSGLVLTADRDLDWTGGSKQILLRKPDGGVTDPISVTRGTADNKIVLPSAAPTTINFDNDYEYTSFAFGTSTTMVRDFIVTTVTPNEGNTVTVDAVNYAPSIFTGAMSYMSS